MNSRREQRKDFAVLEVRREAAARMFSAGTRQAEIARTLRVSRQSVSRWYKSWIHGGEEALKSAKRAGRKPRLGGSELKAIASALRSGPRASGYDVDSWTVARVAEVTERVTGVRYHRGHMWRILRYRIRWSRRRTENGVVAWIPEG